MTFSLGAPKCLGMALHRAILSLKHYSLCFRLVSYHTILNQVVKVISAGLQHTKPRFKQTDSLVFAKIPQLK